MRRITFLNVWVCKWRYVTAVERIVRLYFDSVVPACFLEDSCVLWTSKPSRISYTFVTWWSRRISLLSPLLFNSLTLPLLTLKIWRQSYMLWTVAFINKNSYFKHYFNVMSSDVVVSTFITPLAGGTGTQFPEVTIFYFLLTIERGSGAPAVSSSVGTKSVFLDKESESCYLYSRIHLYSLHRSKFYRRKVAIVLGTTQ